MREWKCSAKCLRFARESVKKLVRVWWKSTRGNENVPRNVNISRNQPQNLIYMFPLLSVHIGLRRFWCIHQNRLPRGAVFVYSTYQRIVVHNTYYRRAAGPTGLFSLAIHIISPKHSLRVGWRNLFSSCAVVSCQFLVLAGNRFWFTYSHVLRVQYSCGVIARITLSDHAYNGWNAWCI